MTRRLVFLCWCLLVPAVATADWRSDADARIERLRKGDFTVELRDAAGSPIPGARVDYRLTRHAFLFGMAIAYAPFADPGEDGRHYRQFILDHFSGLVCENEMKWYDNEAQRGREDYTQADALLAFAEQNGLAMRGHNIFWAKPKYAMPWLHALDRTQLRSAVEHRLASIVSRYRGRVVSWDVNNEMLDGAFFRERLGPDIVPWMFRETARLDPQAQLFVNEYGIFGDPAKTERLIALVRGLQAAGAPVGGIGLQAHDSDRLGPPLPASPGSADRPELRLSGALTPEMFLAALDRLYAATRLPIHITEVSARTPDPVRRGEDLDRLFRLGFSHEAVQAIVLWGFGAKTHWMGPDAALMDADNTLNAAGIRIGHLLSEEWTTRGSSADNTAGRVGFRGFFGRYAVTITVADGRTIARTIDLTRSAPNAVIQIGP